MSAVGSRINYVDTQDVSLEVGTENQIFTQVTNVRINREHNVTTHYLTDDTVERIANLEIPSIEGDVVLTTPQITIWNTLLTTTVHVEDVTVGGLLPVRDWTLTFTDQDNNPASYVLTSGKVTQFYAIDSGLGAATHHFVIEGISVT